VSQETQTGTCLSKSHSFTPPAGNLYIRFSASWSSGDYYLNFDNVTLSESVPVCTGTPAAANITGTSVLCANSGTTLSLSTIYSLSGITRQWKSSLTPGGPYTNLGTGATQATGNLTATTYYICDISCAGGDTYTTPEFTVAVNQLPAVTVSASSPSFCNPGGTAVTLTAGGALTYTWSPATGLSTTIGGIVNATPANTTAYVVTGTDGNGCQSTANTTVIVYGYPQGVSATATPATVCAGGTTTLNAFASIPSSVKDYAFSASTDTYNALIGGVSSTASGDDGTQTSIPLGFPFTYNGQSFTTFGISTNGTIQLGTSATSFTNSLSGNANVIAPFWDDNNRNTGNISYLVTGTAPNRVLTVDWNAVSVSGGGSSTNSVSSYQIQLFETTNVIKFIYGSLGSPISAPSASIGLSGSVGSYLSVTPGAPATTSTTAENSGISSVTFLPSGTVYTFTPPSGTFTWSPVADVVSPNSQTTATNAIAATQTFSVIASNNGCNSDPVSTTVTVSPLICSAATYTSPNCAGTNFTVTANISGGGAPYSYAWSDGAGGVYPDAATITANLPAGTYNFTCVVSDSCGASCSSNVTVVVNALPTVTVSPTSALYCNPSTPIAITASGAATYAWSPATGLSAATGSVVNASPSVTTTYTVVGTDANGCAAPSASSTITVEPGPTAITVSSSAATVCNGTAVTLTANGGNVATSATYPAVGTTPIIDNTYNTLPVTVSGLPANAVISKIEVVFDITHTWDSDVQLNLQSPNGKIVNLVSNAGGSGDNFTNTTVTSDLSAPAFSTGAAPFTNGVYTASLLDLAVTNSTTNFSELFAAPFNGTWTLQTYDTVGGDTGTLNSAAIRIYYSAPTTTSWTASSGTLYSSVNPDVAYVSGDNAAVLYARPTTATTYTASASLGGCTSTGSTSVAVNQLPVFSVAPITICNGTTGTLAASSLESNSYAWTPVGGGATLSGASVLVSPSETTTYNVTATSNTTVPACSSSQQVTVTVNEPGTIVSGTASRTVSPGQLTTFEVVTTGLVSYQWQVNDNVNGWQDILAADPNYSGENTAVLSLQNITLAFDTYQYRCLVTGLAPCVTLTPIEAVLNVTNTGFSTQPADVNLCGQTSTTFSIVTTGDEPYNVQWQMSTDNGATFNDIFDGPDASGLVFSGANDLNPKTLSVSGIDTIHSGYQFKCQLDFFLDSGIATLTVNTPVSLTNNFSTTPVVRCSAPSAVATSFGISTSGSVAGVEWKYATSASGPWNAIAAGTPAGATYSGVTSNTISVTTSAATPVGNYYYKAFVTGAGSGPNKCADAQSDVATVTVVNPAITVTASSTVYCAPGTPVTLTAGGSDINSYSWSTTESGGSINVTPSSNTTYTVTGTDSNGCTNTAQVTVNSGSSFTASAVTSAATVCPGNPVTLTASSALINLVPTPMPVSNYTFESTTDTFTSIVGGVGTTAVTLSSMDDSISALQTLPFTFNYGGNNFTSFKINSNGWIQMGGASTSSTNYSSLSGTDNNIIAAFSRDLNGNNTTSTSYYVQTSGTVGSRITKIQWTNIRSFSSTVNPASGTFQIWLYEGSNRVEIRYGSFTTDATKTSTGTVQVGLRGATNAAVNMKSLSNTGAWSSPTVGSTTSATVALGNFSAPILPDNGRVYRFSPLGNGSSTYTYAWSSAPAGYSANTAVATANPTANTTYTVLATSNAGCTASASVAVAVDAAPAVITTQPLTQQLCQGATATLSVAATSGTALSYQWFKDNVAITGNASATTATLTLTGTTPASSGSYYVTVTNCSTVTSETAVLTVYPTPTAVAPVAQAYCIDAIVPATPLTGTPSGVTFNISGGAALGLANQTGVTEIPSFAPTAAGTATISITPVANGCPGTAVTYNLTINPLPTAPVLSSNSPVCEGSTLSFNSVVAVQQGYTLNSNSNVAFIDISATGTSVGTISDDSEHNITIPSFLFNSVPYTTARVGNNGVLVFGATAGDINYTNLALPTGLNFNGSGLMSNTAGAALTAICALWDDLTPGTGGSIRTQTVGNKFIVQWTQEDNFGATGTGTVTFQVQLDLVTSQIHLVYPDVLYGVIGYDNAQTATIGLNYSATSALQYSFNTASILNGQSLTFTPATYAYAWSGPNGFTSTLANPTIANATPAASGNYSLEITNGNGCKSSSTIAAVVHPTPSAVAPANQLYYNGLATAAIPLTGTPSGVTFDISGGASIGLANATGLTTIPSFIPVAGSATVTITPKANGCTGPSVTYDIVVSAVSTNPIANQTYCEGATTTAIPLSASPASLSTDVGVTFNIIGGASVGLADVNGVTAIPSFVPTPGSATIFVYPVYGGVVGGFASATITVNPLPTASISGTTAVCQNDTAPVVTFTGATGTAPYTFTYKFNGGSNQTIVSSGNTATIAQPTGTAGTFTYTLVSVQDSSSTTCSNAQSGTATIVVHPTPTVAPVPNQTYYSGFATAVIPLTGTPSGVTFNISGGAASGLADVNGVTAIPSFIPTATPSTVTITPVANGCIGIPTTYQISFNPVVVNIESNVCGSINNGLNNQINCTNVTVPGYTVTGYQFEVTNMATGEVSIVFSSQHHFKLTDASNYSYGTTFSIRVAAVLNGQVQGYFGSTCSLTTTEVRTTTVIPSQCGATLVFVNSTINANTVSSTNLYRFRVALASAPTVTYLIERTVPNFKLTDVVGLPIQFDTEYLVDVQVRVKLAGFEAWSQYGQRCSVFTPQQPETFLVASQCEDYAVPTTTTPINAVAFPGATAYSFRLTGYDEFGDVAYQQTVTNATPSFTLSQFTGLIPGATYTVGVSMQLFGIFTAYGKDCSIIVPLITKIIGAEPFKATAYPNPFAANFMIDVKTSSTSVIAIKVYDMVGRLVEQKSTTVTELENTPIGNNYPSGVYNVVVTQDETVQTVRVVKR
jgi:subtilisin-like proprotein convertase family protein